MPPPTNPPQQRIMGRDSTTYFGDQGRADGARGVFQQSQIARQRVGGPLRPPLCTQNRDSWRGLLCCPHTDLGNDQLTPSTPSLARQACVLQRRAQFRPSPLQPSPLQPSPPQPTRVPHLSARYHHHHPHIECGGRTSRLALVVHAAPHSTGIRMYRQYHSRNQGQRRIPPVHPPPPTPPPHGDSGPSVALPQSVLSLFTHTENPRSYQLNAQSHPAPPLDGTAPTHTSI